MKRYICSIPNAGLEGPIRELFYSDDAAGYAQAEEFARREDQPGRSVYDAVNLFHDDATSRRIVTVAALTCIHADIDLKDTEIDREEALRRIKSLEYPPDLVVDSGHGFHLYYRFREPVPTDRKDAAQARSLRTRLVEFLGADRAPDQDAALMRRPGTTNSKEAQQPVLCSIITGEALGYAV